MRVRQEELLCDVKDCEDRSKLVFQARCGGFGDTKALISPVLSGRAAGRIRVHARGARTRGRGDEGQYRLQEFWEATKKAPGPIRIEEERACGQHSVGKHSCGTKIMISS